MFKRLSKDTVIQRKNSSETVQTILDQRKELCAIVTSNPSAKAAFKALKRIGATGFEPYNKQYSAFRTGHDRFDYSFWYANVSGIQVKMWRNSNGEWSYA